MGLKELLLNIPTKIGNVTDKVGSALGTALIGKQELPIEYVNLKGVDTTSPEFAENMPVAEIGVTEAPRVGGLLNDIRAGAKENFTTGFAAPNWEETITPDGRKKGLGYRFGEGVGSLARFAESPLGRGLIMAGIVGASGGSGLEALGYGTGAGLLNQQSRLKDTMYRNELEKMGFDTSGIRGYVGDDTFNKIFQSKQLQDNADYRNALLASNLKNQETDAQLAQAKLEQEKVNNATKNALEQQKINLERLKIENEKNKGQAGALGNLQAVNQQLQRFEESFATMPNKFESNTLGRLRNATGFQTKEEANFNSQRQLLFNKIARDLGGEKGVLSDQDIKRIEGALPSYTDSMVQKQAKMQAIYDLLNDRLAVEGGSLDNTQTTTNADAIVNKLKQNGYSDAEISEYLRMKGY